ncbi:MAG: permease-like cell division protein FtsX [Gemmatimonadota bacterium]
MRLVTREALLSFRRAPLLSSLSVTTIAFSLFVVGLFGLVAINLRQALRTVEERVEVVAYLLRGTPAEALATASEDIAAFPEVQSVDYVSADQALERARTSLVEFRDIYRDLQVNPLPASLEIGLKEGFRDAEHVQAVAERLKAYQFVEDVRYGRDWIERLDRVRNVAGLVVAVIGLAFAVVAVVIIGTTIRMTVLQRAREISIMRLVGAGDWFIRGPFLLEGALKGLLGGALAILLCYLGYLLFRGQENSTFTGLVFFRPFQLVMIGFFGVLLGLGASLISVGRHLRNV